MGGGVVIRGVRLHVGFIFFFFGVSPLLGEESCSFINKKIIKIKRIVKKNKKKKPLPIHLL